MRTDLQNLVVDLINGEVKEYSTAEANDLIRNKINEYMLDRNGNVDINMFRKNRFDIYALLIEIWQPAHKPYELPEELKPFIQTEHIAFGEKAEFDINTNAPFEVYRNVDGNIDIRRQTAYEGKVYVPTESFAIKIYAELKDFLAGRIDFMALTNRVRKSMDIGIEKRIGEMFGELENVIDEETGAFDPDKLVRLIEAVEEKYDTSVAIYGKKSVLGKVQDVVQSEESKKDFNEFGFYGAFRGTPMIKVPTKADYLTIVPVGSHPLALVVYEGVPLIFDPSDLGVRNDLQIEFYLGQNVGFAKVATEGAKYTIQ